MSVLTKVMLEKTSGRHVGSRPRAANLSLPGGHGWATANSETYHTHTLLCD